MHYRTYLVFLVFALTGIAHAQEPTIIETRNYLEINGVRFFPSIFDSKNPCAVNLQNYWFYFSDLDASRIFVAEKTEVPAHIQRQTDIGWYSVRLNTVNNELRLRTPHSSYRIQNTVSGRAALSVSGFESKDQAKRVANAFRHAIKLCGGNSNSDFFEKER